MDIRSKILLEEMEGRLYCYFFLLVLFWFRFQILGLIGTNICDDELQKVQVAFILGGNSQIRAEKAAEVYDLSIYIILFVQGASQ